MYLNLINLLLAIVPAVLLILYFLKKDSQKKEPKKLIWKTFVIGFFSVIPAIFIESFIEPLTSLSGSLQQLFLKAFIVAALVEEGIKFLVVRLYIVKKYDFDEITDGIVYTITASLGFACFENILYSSGGISTILLRAVTAVPLHAIASGIMGYYIGKAKISGKNYLHGLFWAILIHGLYDFLLFTNTALALLTIPLLIFSGLTLKKLLLKALELDRLSGRS